MSQSTQPNSEITKRFFEVTDSGTKRDVLQNIANHYGCSIAQAEAEVTTEPCEHLLDYVTGPMRGAACLIMKRHGLF